MKLSDPVLYKSYASRSLSSLACYLMNILENRATIKVDKQKKNGGNDT